jgi:hypothetical protein
VPLLEESQYGVGSGAERECQLEARISAKRRLDEFADGSEEPGLAHPHDGAEDPKEKSAHRGQAGRELRGRVVDGEIIAPYAPFVQKVLRERNALVDGKPVALNRRQFVRDG